ncbi:MAG: tetratricopeptide repeat protein [Gemmatimonadota bacterium]|nr:MAG: tetratricopeptide repeat protein [Gemmatimonadota bacterium]
MSRLKRLIVEAHQRSLWQVLLVYLGASFAVLEAADLLIERFGLPGWLFPVAFTLLVVGLPVVVVSSLAKEDVYGDEVPKEHAEAAAEEDRRLRHFTWRTAGLSFMAALALWGVVAAGLLLFGGYGPLRTDERPSIAVLPFDNLSPDPENEFFTDGMHDEIIAQLSKIADLKVISRTSVMEYKGRSQNLRIIAEELGVTNILEGTVRRADGRVRITTQLMDALADEHLWAEMYERNLSDVFAVQSAVAQEVAAALRVELTAAERERIEARPTENLEAYDYYLRGNEYLNRGWLEADVVVAEQMYEKAIQLDPSFALAYARLSRVHDVFYWWFHDRSEARLAKQQETAERALQLQPDLPEAHLALGDYYYHGRLDYDRALQEVGIARRSQPDNSDVLTTMGWIQRRQGNWERAAENLARGSELDPRSQTKALAAGLTYFRMRNYAQAEAHYDRAIALAPDRFHAYLHKAGFLVSWKGSTAQALEVLRQAWRIIRPRPVYAGNESWLWWLHRTVGPDYEEALGRLSSGSFGRDTASYLLTKAELYGLSGKADLARAHYDSARAILERKVEARPGEARFHSELGVAYAGLGRKTEAVREGRIAVELLPVSKDAYDGSDWAVYLALIYTMVGEYDAAVDQLEYTLSIPGFLSAALLRVDPIWDPLRSHPRVQALLERWE